MVAELQVTGDGMCNKPRSQNKAARNAAVKQALLQYLYFYTVDKN